MNKEKEIHWSKKWQENNIYKVNIFSSKPKYYVLDMFPYPSGAGLHVGHTEGYTASDIVARYKKLNGFEVLHPMGFDSFGLPAEQYAIKTGNSPKEFTMKNINNFKHQLSLLGYNYDWTREVVTSEPWYYKHTQWIFGQLFKHGLAELKDIDVNWSQSLNTVLSNEEVVTTNGIKVSERDGKPVEKRKMRQWVLKITNYAEKLFNGLEKLDWPNGLKNLQKYWIYEEGDNVKKIMHLKDWIFSRQRYWGEPFPIIHKNNGEIYLIPEIENFPILPEINDYKFDQDGNPALAKAKVWKNHLNNLMNIEGTMDFNTMPQWAGSCWYFLAYILKKPKDNVLDKDEILSLTDKDAKKLLNEWMPVDLYIGGQEHAVLHLLYARFWNIFLSEIGILDIKEPFQKLFNQGMILGPDGQKMSKSLGNVVDPIEIIDKFGADALRIYIMFMGPLDIDKPWSSSGISASYSWLKRVETFFTSTKPSNQTSTKIKKAFNKLLDKSSKYIEELKFNMAITELMVFINELYKDPVFDVKLRKNFSIIISIFCPHLGDELFNLENEKIDFTYLQDWPIMYQVESSEQIEEILIQINGKVKSKIRLDERFSYKDEWKNYKIIDLNDIDENFNIFLDYLISIQKLNKENISKVIYIHKKMINFILN